MGALAAPETGELSTATWSGHGGLKPIFRDREELAASRDLSETIRNALADSEHLIVICSPASAQSHWVAAEIEHFIALGHDASVLCLIVDGKPGDEKDECLPLPLRDREPLGADVRPSGDGRRNALIKIAAGLLNVPLDALRRRDMHRRQRRMALISAASFAGMVGAFALAFVAQQARDAAQQEAEKARQITGFLVDVFKRADPAETRRRDMTARELLEESAAEISTRFEKQEDVLVDLSNEVGSIFESYAEFAQAEALFLQAAAHAERAYGDDTLEYARSIRGVARMLLMQDRYEDAIQLARRGLAVEEKILGPNNPDLAGALSDLAGSLIYAGDFGPEAIEMLERAEQLHQRSGKPDNEDAIATEFRLAGLYREQGRFNEAIPRYESALRRLEHIDARPDRRAMVLAELGNALGMAERAEESLTSYDEAISILAGLYGDEHANLANIWLFKSHLLLSMQETEPARNAIDNAVRIASNSLGSDSDLVSFALEAKLRLHLMEEEIDEAVELGDELLDRWTASVGTDHVDTANAAILFAEALVAAGRTAEAIELTEQAADTLGRFLPEDHPRIQYARSVEETAISGLSE